MLQTNGYILLPQANEDKWNVDELQDILNTWSGYEDKVQYEMVKSDEAEEIVKFTVDAFTVVLSYKKKEMMQAVIAELTEPQRLANEPEDKKRKLQFEHTMVPMKDHVAHIRYEISYGKEAEGALYATETVLDYVKGVLRILLSTTDMMEGSAIARSAFMDGREDEEYLLVSRECLADSYYQNTAERSIPMALFGRYTIDSIEKFHVSGSITDVKEFFGADLSYVQFPLADKDLYRVLSRGLYEALAHRSADSREEIFAWEDRTISFDPKGENGPTIIWDNNDRNYVGIR